MIKGLVDRLEHVPPSALKCLLSGILWEGDPGSGRIALTFDDGPDPVVTPRVLDVLDEYGARGTFFMRGDAVAAHPDVARMVVERGHLAGNHTMTHQTMFLMGRERTTAEIDDASSAIADATGTAPELFRPPQGIFDMTVLSAVRERRLGMILWTVLSGDYSDDAPGMVLERIRPFVRPGAVVVFHDTMAGGGSELEPLVRETCLLAVDGGLALSGIDDLMTYGTPEIDDGTD